VDFMHLELNPAPSCAPASPSSLNSVEDKDLELERKRVDFLIRKLEV
jgi:hypothetical protein